MKKLNMNQPSPNAGYISFESSTKTAVTCKFCKSILLPIATSMMVMSTSAAWLCVRCPNPVTYDSELGNHSILCLHNEHWYDIIYLTISKQYLIFKLESSLVVNGNAGKEHYTSNRICISQIESENNITPSNAKDKLSTILTFS